MAINNIVTNPQSAHKGQDFGGESRHFVEGVIKSWNAINEQFGRHDRLVDTEINYEGFVKEYTDIQKSLYKKSYQKAVTGGTEAAGSGLVQEEFVPFTQDMIADILGGGFRASGINRRENTISHQFVTSGELGRFQSQTSNPASPTTNDISPTFDTVEISLLQQIAEIDIYDAPVLANYVTPAQLISVFRAVLEQKKDQREDELGALAVTSNAGVTALGDSPNSEFPIAERILKARMEISKFGRPSIYLNEEGLYSLLNERDADGNFNISNTNYKFIMMDVGGNIPRVGRVGTYLSCPVFLIPEIKSTYTKNASRVITGQTGGTSTAVLVGIPRHLGAIRGYNSMDYVTVFDGRNSRDNFRQGTTTIGAKTFMNAAVLNTNTWRYHAFDV